MKKNLVSILLIVVVLLGSVIALTGCGNKKDEEKEPQNMKEELESIKYDAKVHVDLAGGDCIQYTDYYINYAESKLYMHEFFQVVPLQQEGEKTPAPTESLTEYTLNKDIIDRLKGIISKREESNNYSMYTVKVGNDEYQLGDSKAFDTIIEEIKNK